MDERLLIEATPELLDGWCGPVAGRCGDGRWFRLVHADGVAINPNVWMIEQGPVHESWSVDGNDLHLDLARAECRDRVVRRLAHETTGGAVGDLGWWWGLQRATQADRRDVWALWYGPHPWRCYGPEDVGGLDPHDDTRLPDGSRLVDALALAAVWREVSR